MSGYIFAARDNVAQPQTYMYSSTTLAEYADARRVFIEEARDRLRDTSTDLDLAGESNVSQLESPYVTETLLLELMRAEASGAHDDHAHLWLALRRGFEIRKRVHTRYTAEFKPATTEFDEPHLYALMAAAFGLRSRRGDLRDLNVLLKLNDTAQSISQRFTDPQSWVWALFAMECELAAMTRLHQAVTA